MTTHLTKLLALFLLIATGSSCKGLIATQALRSNEGEQERIIAPHLERLQSQQTAALDLPTLDPLSPQTLATAPLAFPARPSLLALAPSKKSRRASRPQANPPAIKGYLAAAPASLTPLSPYDPHVRDNIVTFAKQFLGVRYVYGGKTPKGFDCSGFTSFVLNNFGYNITPASAGQAHQGEQIDRECAQKGDLLIFGQWGPNGTFRTSHAALVISEPGEPLMMIHSARGGVKIDHINGANWRSYYGKRFLFARRVINEPVQLAAVAPAEPVTSAPPLAAALVNGWMFSMP
jgi:cell wall-associated NlpC family hydrolase